MIFILLFWLWLATLEIKGWIDLLFTEHKATLWIKPVSLTILTINFVPPNVKIFVDSCCLQDLEKEYQRQAFFQSKVADGEITAVKFAEIMKTLRGHKLSPFVRNYLLTVSNGYRTEWSPIRSLIMRVINICLITSLITDWIRRHKVLLPINHNFNKICDIIGYF